MDSASCFFLLSHAPPSTLISKGMFQSQKGCSLTLFFMHCLMLDRLWAMETLKTTLPLQLCFAWMWRSCRPNRLLRASRDCERERTSYFHDIGQFMTREKQKYSDMFVRVPDDVNMFVEGRKVFFSFSLSLLYIYIYIYIASCIASCFSSWSHSPLTINLNSKHFPFLQSLCCIAHRRSELALREFASGTCECSFGTWCGVCCVTWLFFVVCLCLCMEP